MSESIVAPLKVRYLESVTKNATAYDRLIQFTEADHSYTCFNPYLGDWVSTSEGLGCLPLKSTTGIISHYFPTNLDPVAIRILSSPKHKELVDTDNTYRYYGCRSVGDIRSKWFEGATAGTKMHGHFEDMGNLTAYYLDHKNEYESSYFATCERMRASVPEYMYFEEFCEYFGIHRGSHEFYRTEFCMFHPELHISGMIDGLLYNPSEDGYVIIDYKRCKGGVKKPPKNPRKPVHELSVSSRGRHLPCLMVQRNMPLVKYGIQLSIYRRMFERMFREKNMRVIGMYLIVVDSQKIGRKDALEVIEIPLDRHERHVDAIFHDRAKAILSECQSSMLPEQVKEVARIYHEFDHDEDEFVDCGVGSKRTHEEAFEKFNT